MPNVPVTRCVPVRRFGLLLALILTSACDVMEPVACTADFVFGISVTALDADTGAPITQGLQGTTVQGGTSAPMEVNGNTLRGAGETAGAFTVGVTATGYDLWTRSGVEVTKGECHVRPVQLTAELVSASTE